MFSFVHFAVDDPEGTFFYAAGTFAFIHSLWGVGLSHAYLNTVREKGRSICTRAHLGLELVGKLIMYCTCAIIICS